VNEGLQRSCVMNLWNLNDELKGMLDCALSTLNTLLSLSTTYDIIALSEPFFIPNIDFVSVKNQAFHFLDYIFSTQLKKVLQKK